MYDTSSDHLRESLESCEERCSSQSEQCAVTANVVNPCHTGIRQIRKLNDVTCCMSLMLTDCRNYYRIASYYATAAAAACSGFVDVVVRR